MKRLLFPVLLAAALAGCGEDAPVAAPTPTPSASATATSLPTSAPTTARPTPTGSAECRDLAAVVRTARLGGRPTEEVAEKAADAVHEKLSRLSSKVHDPAVDLHGHLHDYGDALKRDRTERADLMLDRSRDDARDLAKACGMAESDFLAP